MRPIFYRTSSVVHLSVSVVSPAKTAEPIDIKRFAFQSPDLTCHNSGNPGPVKQKLKVVGLVDVVVVSGSSRSEESDDNVSLLSVPSNHARVSCVRTNYSIAVSETFCGHAALRECKCCYCYRCSSSSGWFIVGVPHCQFLKGRHRPRNSVVIVRTSVLFTNMIIK